MEVWVPTLAKLTQLVLGHISTLWELPAPCEAARTQGAQAGPSSEILVHPSHQAGLALPGNQVDEEAEGSWAMGWE